METFFLVGAEVGDEAGREGRCRRGAEGGGAFADLGPELFGEGVAEGAEGGGDPVVGVAGDIDGPGGHGEARSRAAGDGRRDANGEGCGERRLSVDHRMLAKEQQLSVSKGHAPSCHGAARMCKQSRPKTAMEPR